MQPLSHEQSLNVTAEVSKIKKSVLHSIAFTFVTSFQKMWLIVNLGETFFLKNEASSRCAIARKYFKPQR